MTSPTPKVLTEADLAGLPRSVSSEDARGRVSLFTVYADIELRDSDNNMLAIFPAHRRDEARRVVACWNALEGVPTKEIEAVLIHGKALKDVVSERDALAGRVAELEANARRYEWLRAQHWSGNKLGVVLRPMDNTKLGCFIPSLELLDDAIDHMSAALSATTPESKP